MNFYFKANARIFESVDSLHLSSRKGEELKEIFMKKSSWYSSSDKGKYLKTMSLEATNDLFLSFRKGNI